MIVASPAGGDQVVVELGPGTGVFTEAIQHRLVGRGRHLAIELNPAMAAYVSRRCPGVDVVTGTAAAGVYTQFTYASPGDRSCGSEEPARADGG